MDQLQKDGFSKNPLYEALIFELDDLPVGMALYYNRYSTWKGKSLYLEDLYIVPEFRGYGFGQMAMKYLAEIAYETKCYRFEWQCLDWNEPSIEFYKALGATIDPEWVNCRVEGSNIEKIAKTYP